MLSFTPISLYKPHDLFKILYESYRELFEKYDPINKKKYIESWRQFDKNSFDNLNIGKCVFVSCINNKPVGLASYDPRYFPEYGIIGQNCILPEFKGKGYGQKQIQELLRIFKENCCKKAKVTAGNNDFFIPAHKMYRALGFKEISRYYDEKWGYEIIEYEKDLTRGGRGNNKLSSNIKSG